MTARRASLTAIVTCALVSSLAVVYAAANAPTFVTRYAVEPVIAIDPVHPSLMVAGSNPNPSLTHGTHSAMALYRSTNGGKTFTGGIAPLPASWDFGSDPSMAFTSDGALYYTFLVGTRSYCGGPRGSSGVLVEESLDGGATFPHVATLDASGGDDKPFMAVRSVPGRPAHVYVAWTKYGSQTEILFTRSLDGGRHFSTPIPLFQGPGAATGAYPVVAPSGRVYVFYALVKGQSETAPGTEQIALRRSTDDGMTFSPQRTAAGPFATLPGELPPDYLRNPPFFAAAATAKGRLYLAWTQETGASAGTFSSNIMLSSSTGGHSWQAPQRVNDVVNGDRFMPALAAFPDGSVGVSFYDQRAGYLDVFAAHATFKDGFEMSRDVRLNQARSLASNLYQAPKKDQQCYDPGRFFGDYMTLAPAGSRGIYAIWTDTGKGVYAETDIWLRHAQLPALRRR